jgi:hypothetical protein
LDKQSHANPDSSIRMGRSRIVPRAVHSSRHVYRADVGWATLGAVACRSDRGHEDTRENLAQARDGTRFLRAP